MPAPAWDERVTWRGHTFTRRAVQSLRWVEEKSGVKIEPVQGSFNRGGVSQSAGTHDGEAVDIRVRNVSPEEIRRLVVWLRKAGWAAWYRAPSAAWGPHVHGVPAGSTLLSASAAQQVRAYDAGLDGLAGNRVDHTWRPRLKRRWSYRLGRPVPRA